MRTVKYKAFIDISIWLIQFDYIFRILVSYAKAIEKRFEWCQNLKKADINKIMIKLQQSYCFWKVCYVLKIKQATHHLNNKLICIRFHPRFSEVWEIASFFKIWVWGCDISWAAIADTCFQCSRFQEFYEIYPLEESHFGISSASHYRVELFRLISQGLYLFSRATFFDYLGYN